MPAKRRSVGSRWQFMRPCASPGCESPTAVRVMGAPGEILYICAEHTLRSFAALGKLRGHYGKCVACNPYESGTPRAFFIDVLDWEGELCASHTVALLAHALTPQEFKRVSHEAGNAQLVHLLSDDYYEEKSGVARIPLLDERDIPILAQYRPGGIVSEATASLTSTPMRRTMSITAADVASAMRNSGEMSSR